MKPLENLFMNLPIDNDKEIFEEILSSDKISIERIVSQGQVSPKQGWYDQEKDEWVLILQGEGRILYDDGREFSLAKGDYLNIPAHTKHKVIWTDPKKATIWLAIHY